MLRINLFDSKKEVASSPASASSEPARLDPMIKLGFHPIRAQVFVEMDLLPLPLLRHPPKEMT